MSFLLNHEVHPSMCYGLHCSDVTMYWALQPVGVIIYGD